MSTKSTFHTFVVTIMACMLAIVAPLAMSIPAFAISNGNIVSLTNSIRSSNGLGSYSQNGALASAARAKAQHMCTHDYWAHTAPDGTTGWNFMRNSGYNYVVAGENLAKGYSTDQSVVNGWMNSAGHRANILHKTYREIGVGNVSCSGSVIVVAMYGTRTSSAPAPASTSTAKPKPAATKPAPAPAPQSQPTTKNQPPSAPKETKSSSPTPEANPTVKKETVQKDPAKKQHPILTILLEAIKNQQLSDNDYRNVISLFNTIPLAKL